MLVCSILSGYYAVQNLSSQSQTVSHNFFHFIGDAAEALVFAYLGLTATTYDLFSISSTFLIAMLEGIIISRFIGTFVLTYFLSLLHAGSSISTSRTCPLFGSGA